MQIQKGDHMKLYANMTKEEKAAYNKKNIPILVVLIIVGTIGFFSFLNTLMNNMTSSSKKDYSVSEVTTTTISVEEQKSKAVKLVFRDAVFEKVEQGTVLKTNASVFWAHSERMLLNANSDYSQGVIVYYDKQPEVLPGDEIVVYGTYDGVEEMLGNKYVRLQHIDTETVDKK